MLQVRNQKNNHIDKYFEPIWKLYVFADSENQMSAPTLEEADEWPSIKEVRGVLIFIDMSILKFLYYWRKVHIGLSF